MKLEQAECSETSAYEVQTPGNYPEENIQQSHYVPRTANRQLNALYFMKFKLVFF